MWEKQTPIQKEWSKLIKQETAYLEKRLEKSDSKINQLLASKVPPTLQGTLDKAFSKAFHTVFEKGTGVIEKTYKKEEIRKQYQINDYVAGLSDTRKSLKAFSKKASGSGTLNLAISGVSGVGLGVLGIGIPDIVLFTGLVLKSVYEIALNYGYDYENEDERRFILLLIQGALTHGKEMQEINGRVNAYIENGRHVEAETIEECISATAGCMSKELLYMKFLQGIPVVGAVGGAYDAIYMKKIVKYAELKYRRRFLIGRKRNKG